MSSSKRPAAGARVLVLVLVALAALPGRSEASPAPPADEVAARASAGDEADEPGLLATINGYYPIVLDDDLEPEVQERLVPLWLTSACCGQLCGALWIPVLLVGEDPGAEYFVKEALIAIALEMLTNLFGGATSAFAGIGSLLVVVNLVYLTPVGIINTYDRALKRERKRKPEARAPPARRSAMAF